MKIMTARFLRWHLRRDPRSLSSNVGPGSAHGRSRVVLAPFTSPGTVEPQEKRRLANRDSPFWVEPPMLSGGQEKPRRTTAD